MKKIILIIPSCDWLKDPVAFPPLGILYLAAVLREKGYNIELHDMRDNKNLQLIPKGDFYCVTSTTLESQEAKRIGKYLEGKGIRIIGGPHASLLPEDFLGYYDAIVIGEGEITLLDIIENRKRGIIKGTPPKNLDSIPFPLRELLSREKILNKLIAVAYPIPAVAPTGCSILTSRSCPFKCSFCANIPQPVRFRSAENVTLEIKELILKYDCHYFDILDDHFTMNKKRLESLIPYWEPLKISFRCQGRSDSITEDICEILKILGCQQIEIGIETVDDEILTLLNKQEKVEDHRRAIEIVKSHNIKARALLMAGLPHETWETIEKIKDFLIETQPDSATPSLFVPYPGCDIFKNPTKYGIRILTKDFSKYCFKDPARSVIETDRCSSEELTSHFSKLRDYCLENKWKRKKYESRKSK